VVLGGWFAILHARPQLGFTELICLSYHPVIFIVPLQRFSTNHPVIISFFLIVAYGMMFAEILLD